MVGHMNGRGNKRKRGELATCGKNEPTRDLFHGVLSGHVSGPIAGVDDTGVVCCGSSEVDIDID